MQTIGISRAEELLTGILRNASLVQPIEVNEHEAKNERRKDGCTVGHHGMRMVGLK